MSTKYEKGSFIQAPNKSYLRGKPAQFQSIYLWICEHSDDNDECFPSAQTLADEAGVDRKTVFKYLAMMESEGLLSVVNRFKTDGGQTSNLYHINIISPVPQSQADNGGRGQYGPTPRGQNGTLTETIVTETNELALQKQSEKTIPILFDIYMETVEEATRGEVMDGDGCPHEVWMLNGHTLTPAKEKQAKQRYRVYIGDASISPKIEAGGLHTLVIDTWNVYPTWKALKRPGTPSNPSVHKVLLPEARLTPEIKAQINKHWKHKPDDFALAIKNYAQDVCNRVPNATGYHLNRMSLYDFLLQKNGFLKFLNR